MLKSYKTEIDPTPEQKQHINRTIGVCRYVYNFYLAYNKEIYEIEKRFVSGMVFSKWLNNEFIPNNPDFQWIKDVSSKSVKQSIMNAERAFKNFFKGKSHFPKFKKKTKADVKMYFVKTDAKVIIQCERHRIKIPTLGWVRLKEKGYIPTNPKTHMIKSGAVSCKAGKYYVSVLVEEQEHQKPVLNDFGIGIDLGLKDFAVCSNGKTYKNINKSPKIRKLEKKLRREQRSLSRKYESYKKLNKNMKGVSELVKTKPMWIAIEDLNVSGVMKNRHLSKAIAQQKFFEFRTKLLAKCNEYGIELRIVDRFYPSSKTCHNCDCIKSDLKLSDRTYHCCECGYTEDRDFNASLNLRDCQTYKIA